MNTQAILGIDVSKDKLDCALLLGSAVHRKTILNDPKGFADLDAWLSELRAQNLHACLEATGRYGLSVSLHLTQSGRQVSVVNPALVLAHGRSRLTRNKNDAADALLIADFCREKQPRPWLAPTTAQRELQELTRLHQERKNDLVREKNRLESAPQSAEVRRLLQKHLRQLEKQIEQIEAAIGDLITGDSQLQQDCQLLESIPGIGRTTAAAILGELWFYAQLDGARAAAAYAGLTPAQRQSGSSLKSSSLCRAGNKRLRKAMYFPAISAMTHNPIIQQKAARWAAAGKRKMQIVAAAMHHLLRIAYGVLKNQTPFDPAWGQRAKTSLNAGRTEKEILKEDKA
jgi:transposase